MYNTLIKNSLWATSGLLFNKTLNFATVTLIAKQLGPEQFGEYNVVQTTLGVFGAFSGMGLGLAATKLIAEWKNKDKFFLSNVIAYLYFLSFIVSFVIFVFFFVNAKWIAQSLLNNNTLAILFKITSIIVIFDSINGVQNGILSGLEKYKIITIINLLTGFISSIVLLISVKFNEITGLTVGLLIIKLLTVIITKVYINRILKKEQIKIVFKPDYNPLKTILKISVPSFLSSITTSPVNWIVTTAFANEKNGYESIGTYNAANQLRQLVLFLPDSAGKITIPQLASSYANNEAKKFKKIFLTTIISNLLFSTLPALFIVIFSFLFKNIIGQEYKVSNDLILIITTTGVLIALTNALGYIFICTNLVWYDFYLRIIWGVSWLITALYFNIDKGANGYGFSILISYIVLLGLQLFALLINLKNKN